MNTHNRSQPREWILPTIRYKIVNKEISYRAPASDVHNASLIVYTDHSACEPADQHMPDQQPFNDCHSKHAHLSIEPARPRQHTRGQQPYETQYQLACNYEAILVYDSRHDSDAESEYEAATDQLLDVIRSRDYNRACHDASSPREHSDSAPVPIGDGTGEQSSDHGPGVVHRENQGYILSHDIDLKVIAVLDHGGYSGKQRT